MSDTEEISKIDDIIERLLSVRSFKPGKEVTLKASEIRELCLKSREIFLSQPVLLELKAPLKILGEFSSRYFTFSELQKWLILLYI